MDFNSIQQQFDNGDKGIKGLHEAKLALEKLNFILENEALDDAQERSIGGFATLLSENLEALNKSPEFFEKAMDTINAIISMDEEKPIDLSAIVPESNHAYRPILKDESDIAVIARDLDTFLYKYREETPITLSKMIWNFMAEKGIEDCADVWKSTGLGRKSWHNLITRYEKEEKHAPKLKLLQISIGLRLDFDETNKLLAHQCYRLTTSKRDLIFVYHIANRSKNESKEARFANAKEEADTVRDELYEHGFTPFSQIFD